MKTKLHISARAYKHTSFKQPQTIFDRIKRHSNKCKSWLNEPCTCHVKEKPCKHGYAVCIYCKTHNYR
jgi:hypothetical protein